MKKIPTVFVRDWDGNPKHVTHEINPECQWVLDGEGTATRKYDGTCVLYDDVRWWARREVKPGKPTPPNFLEAELDPATGKRMGWEPIEQSSFAKFHAEALTNATVERSGEEEWLTGTYELVGPKINGNPEQEEQHEPIRHANAEEVFIHLGDFTMIREQILALGRIYGAEGVVWHHPDGRMAKLKARDFPQ